MKIIVAIKQVPERDATLAIAPDGKWIEESDLSYGINEPDAYALEEALQLKEKNGGEVPTALSISSRIRMPWLKVTPCPLPVCSPTPSAPSPPT
jgi:electron transfer flavoprotein beta subunit